MQPMIGDYGFPQQCNKFMYLPRKSLQHGPTTNVALEHVGSVHGVDTATTTSTTKGTNKTKFIAASASFYNGKSASAVFGGMDKHVQRGPTKEQKALMTQAEYYIYCPHFVPKTFALEPTFQRMFPREHPFIRPYSLDRYVNTSFEVFFLEAEKELKEMVVLCEGAWFATFQHDGGTFLVQSEDAYFSVAGSFIFTNLWPSFPSPKQ